jgi:hypothetical protein
MILATVITCAALLLLLLLFMARRGRSAPALPEPTTPAAPGAPVAARAPGADLSAPLPEPRRRRHDNSGLGHFAGHGTNAPRRMSRTSR